MKNYKENKNFIFDNPFRRHDVSFWIHRIKHALQVSAYKAMSIFYRPPTKVDKEYKVSICGIFKNEANNLKEWIEFHRIVGIDHFFLYNNNSEDDYKSILQPYISSGIVTLVEWPYKQAQSEAYENCIEEYSKKTEWLGFIDIDEFVMPKQNNSIYDLLSRFDKKPAVLIYWKVFGSSGKMNREARSLVTESFFHCFEKLQDIGKCFYNTRFHYEMDHVSSRKRMMHHEFWANCGKIRFPPVNCFGKISFGRFHRLGKGDILIQINHYVTKTYEEYIQKAKGSDVAFSVNPRSASKFYSIDALCTDVDFSAYAYLARLKNNLRDSIEEDART